MIVHIFNESGFVDNFVDLLKLPGGDHVPEDHVFIFVVNSGNGKCYGLPNLRDVYFGSNSVYSRCRIVRKLPFKISYTLFSMKMFRMLYDADLVVFHSFPTIINFSLLMPSVLRKSVWVIWGHDIMDYKPTNRTFLTRAYFHLHYLFKVFLTSHIPHVVSRPSEYSVILQHYNPDAVNHPVPALYPPLFKLNTHYSLSKSHPNKIGVLCGHSAFSADGHLDILKSLCRFPKEHLHIYIPLAYGDAEYMQTVSQAAFHRFGTEQVTILRESLPYEKYCEFIANCIDVAILDAPQQSGLGNIFLLLQLGKKVFLHDDGLNKKICDEAGFHTFNSSLIHSSNLSLEEIANLDANIRETNISRATQYMDPFVAKKQWDDVFKLAEIQ